MKLANIAKREASVLQEEDALTACEKILSRKGKEMNRRENEASFYE